MKKLLLLTTLLIGGLLLTGCLEQVKYEVDNISNQETDIQESNIQQKCEEQFSKEIISTNYEYDWDDNNYYKENSVYGRVTIDRGKIPVFCEIITGGIVKIRIENLGAILNKEYAHLCSDILESEYGIKKRASTAFYDDITSGGYHLFGEIESRFGEKLKYYNCYVNNNGEGSIEFIDAKDYTGGKFDDYLGIEVNYQSTDEMNSIDVQNEGVKRIISYPHQNNDGAEGYINEIRDAMPKFKKISYVGAEQTQKDKEYCKLIQGPGEPFDECLEFIVDFEIIDESGIRKEFNDYKIMLGRVNDGNFFMLASGF